MLMTRDDREEQPQPFLFHSLRTLLNEIINALDVYNETEKWPGVWF